MHVSPDSRSEPIYYGTEQYLHNDTNGGNDEQLRNDHEHLQAHQQTDRPAQEQRGDNDVYIYERAFAGSVILVAISK